MNQEHFRNHESELLLNYRIEINRLKGKLKDYRFIMGMILLVLFIFALMYRNGFEIYVESYDPAVMCKKYSWWGLHSEHFEIKWIDSGDVGGSGWCKKSKDGSWYIFITDIGIDYPVDY